MNSLSVTIPFYQRILPILGKVRSMSPTLKAAVGLIGLAGFAIANYLAPNMPVALIGLSLGVPVIYIAWNRPEIAVVGIVFLSSGFLPANLAEIRLPVGGLELRDVAFLGVLGLIAFKGMLDRSLYIPWWGVGAPLLFFLIQAVFSLTTALVFEGVETNWAFNDMRILIYYGMFFLTAWSIKKPKHLNSILISLFVIADLIAIGIVAQQFLGDSVYLYPGMASGRGMVSDQGGIVRVVPAAHALLHFMVVMAVSLIVFTRKSNKYRFMYGLQLLLLGVSSLLTLTRSQWLASGIAIIIMMLVLFPRFLNQIILFSMKVGIPLLLLLIGFLGFFGTKVQSRLGDIPVVNGIVARADTLANPDDTLATNSIEWRQFEFEQATEAIRKRPFLGVSLGNSYRKITTLQGEAQGRWTDDSLVAGEISRFTRYVHNSYLAIGVKMGLIGLITFLWFCLSFLVKSGLLYRKMPFGTLKGITLAVAVAFIGLLQWSYFMTHFIRSESTIAIGVMAGLIAAIARMQAQGEISVESSGDL